MDKKVGVSVLFGLILLVGLIGLTKFVIGGEVISDSVADVLGNASISLYGDEFVNDTYTKGGETEILNLTVAYGLGEDDNSGGANNITNITIEWVGNFTFLGFVGSDDEYMGACTEEGDSEVVGCDVGNSTAESNFIFSNVTLMNGNPSNWSCYNSTATRVNCINGTGTEHLGPDNTTIQIRFNVTAASGIEDMVDWNITVSSNGADLNGVALSSNSTDPLLNTYVDGLAPRITDINITDGNITLYNNTGYNGESIFVINESWKLNPNTDWIIVASVADLEAQTNGSIQLVYNTSGVPEDENLTALGGVTTGSTAVVDGNGTVLEATFVDTWKTAKANDQNTLTALVKWRIPQGNIIADNVGNTTIFNFLLNDSYDQGRAVNENGVDGADNKGFVIDANSSIPQIVNFNITDGINTAIQNENLKNGSYLAAGNWTISVDISGKGLTNVSVFYNETKDFGNNSLGAPFINGKVPNANGEFTEATTDNVLRNQDTKAVDSATTQQWEVNLKVDANDTNTMAFLVVANATTDAIDAGRSNFSIIGGPYYVTVDSTNPAPELNTPAIRGISTADSIEYTCDANEGASGISKYTWYLKKPGSDNTYTKINEKETADSTHTQKFSGTDINTVGTYTVRCEVTDNVGNLNYKDTTGSNDFTVTISSAGGGTGGAGGGGAAAVSFDVDFTTSPQATFKASQGRVKSFSFDGTTKHTITFNEVTSDGVTLIIASDPVTVKLNVGQSKSVDVNADGADDMKVQLNSVDNGVADVTVTKVEAGAAKIRAEEEKASGVEAGEEGREITPVAGRSLAWLWWTLIVIVAIVVIGYYVNKRK